MAGRGHSKGQSTCAGRHCDDVETYRQTRAQQLADWRDETAEAITFKDWLQLPGRFERDPG